MRLFDIQPLAIVGFGIWKLLALTGSLTIYDGNRPGAQREPDCPDGMLLLILAWISIRNKKVLETPFTVACMCSYIVCPAILAMDTRMTKSQGLRLQTC